MTLLDLAGQAAAHWGPLAEPLRLIDHRENAVFEARFTDGRRGALRLHRVGYRRISEIRSEMIWTDLLAQRGLSVPKPLLTDTGEGVVTLSTGQVATCIAWIDGAPIGSGDQPLTGNLADQMALYQAIGRVLADLHLQSDALILPAGFDRAAWDIEALVGPDPLWGRYWDNAALTAPERDEVLAARALARQSLEAMEHPDYGLIHADALRENVFRHGESITLIDYDDGGFGFRLYELACCLTQSIEDETYEDLKSALLTGYRQRRPLPQADADLLPIFDMLRCFQGLGWAMTRVPADAPRMAAYVRKALLTARRVMDQFGHAP